MYLTRVARHKPRLVDFRWWLGLACAWCALHAFAQPAATAWVDRNSAWLAQGRSLLQTDASGEIRLVRDAGAPIVAVAGAGRAAALVATREAVFAIRADGIIEARWNDLAGAPATLALQADLARGFVWVIRSSDIVGLDAYDGLRERLRLPIAGTSASAFDAGQGLLWVVADGRLCAAEADGTILASIELPPNLAAGTATLSVDSARSVARLDHADASIELDLATLVWRGMRDRPALPEGTPTFVPTLEMGADPERPRNTLSLRIRPSCAPVECRDDPRYTGHATFVAAVGNVDATRRIERDGGGNVFLTLRDDEIDSGARVRIAAVDGYGNPATAAAPLDALFRDRHKTNALPNVAIIAPAGGAVAVAPAAFNITATASDSDGTIVKVEFYRNGVLLGADASAPYAWSWTAVPIGTYSLTAKAYDNAGGIKVSAAVSVQVKANVAPTVSLVSPPNGSNFVAPATITLSANATDSDGTVARVDFLRGGSTAIGSITTKPYTYVWRNVPAGTYSLTAKATDDKGASTTSVAITAKVNNPPSVAITSPASGSSFVAPASVTVKANAADTDGTIAKVEFFRDGALFGTDTTNPYSVAWSNVAPGSYVWTAKATDNLGATTISAPVAVTVAVNQPPVVALTAPGANLQRYAGSTLSLAATASDPDGSIARVEFWFGATLVATDSTSPYSASATVPAGVTVVTAVAVDNLGLRKTSAPVTLTGVVNQPPVVTLTAPAMHTSVVSAAPVDLSMSATVQDPDGSVVRVRFVAAPMFVDTTFGAPIVIATIAAPPYVATWRAVPPIGGNVVDYEVWAEADDDAGATAASAHAQVFVSDQPSWDLAILEPTPAAQLTLDAPATITVVGRAAFYFALDGDVADPDPLTSLELLSDGIAIATLPLPHLPYAQFTTFWRNVPVGIHALQLRGTDAAGFVVTGPPVNVQVRAPDLPPAVRLVSPSMYQLIPVATGGATSIPMAALASDADGTVQRVDLTTDSDYSPTVFAPPWSAPYANVLPGVHMLSARATDDRGVETESAPVFALVSAFAPAPVVAITSPTPGATFSPGMFATLTADAQGIAGVSKVEFYTTVNHNLIGTATAPPWSIVWRTVPGQNQIVAVAYSATNGSNAGSTPVTLNILSNVPPVITVSAPRPGQAFAVGEAVPIMAYSVDPDGTVARVVFAVSGATIATVASAPYGTTWTPAAPGTYAITATATDAQGASTLSAPVAITVVPAVAAVSITAPSAAATLVSGNPIDIVAQTVMPGRSVSYVQYMVDGVVAGSVSVGGSGSVANTTFHWTQASPGPHTLVARSVATDNSTLSSPAVVIQVGDFSVALAEPYDGQVFVMPAEIRIQAAPSGALAGIARVEFTADGALIGSASAPPFAYVWRGAGFGSHVIGVRAVDTQGTITSSGPVLVRVVTAPGIVIDNGQDNSVQADDVMRITGRLEAPVNAALVVNGRPATIDPQGNFVVENVPLAPGSNLLTVTLNTLDAPPVQRVLAVNSAGSAPFSVDFSPQDGFAPLLGTLTIRNRGNVPFARIEIDAQDDGRVDATLTSLVDNEARIDYTITGAGVFPVKVTVYDATNRVIYQARRQLRVFDRAELAGKVVGTYFSMVERLAAGNAAGALRVFTGDAQSRYAEIFAALGSNLAAVAPELRHLVDGVVGDDLAELTLVRDTAQGPTLFMIYLLRGRDGLWRVDSL